ncbi:hypothetical protein CLOP_g3958 [Closterium sp. NIES-67]|nr:hypothetical protein CLOP_g3958 [Closterium sp. NIES-67]
MSYYGGSNPSPYDYPLPGGPHHVGMWSVTGLTGGYGSEKKGKGRHFKGHFKGHHKGHGIRGHHGGHKHKGIGHRIGKHLGGFRHGRKHK